MNNNIQEFPIKYIFIHVPKTGGKSIFTMLTNLDKDECNHSPAVHVKTHLGNSYDNYFSFAFVRNPWDRMVSLYNYSRQCGSALREQYEYQRKEISFETFDDFINDVYDNRKTRFFNIHMRTQSWYVCEGDDVIVKYLGKYETFNEDVKHIFSTIGIELPKTLNHINKTVRKSYSYYYDEDLRYKVEELFKEDIERFGYSFDDNT